MGIKKTLFGTIPGEGDVQLYTITNAQGASISVSTLGAGLVRLLMPDRNGVLGDCILGYDFPDPYLDARNGYQGLVVGRFANRIAGGRFHIDGIEYNVPKNQDNCLCLHGAGRLSFHNWNEVQSTDNSVTLSFFSPDMEDGFPGNFTCTVRYILTAANTVRIEYRVESDCRTIANVTNHAYFNLACDERNIDDHLLTVHADYYTETDEHIVPTGNLKPLQDTPLDFTAPKRIGDGFAGAHAELEAVGGGYDHNFCLRNDKGTFAHCARLEEPEFGRVMDVYTDLPGVQVYTSNSMPESVGKKGLISGFHRGICLETQLYPDAPNQPTFPSCMVEPGQPFETATEFRFPVK